MRSLTLLLAPVREVAVVHRGLISVQRYTWYECSLGIHTATVIDNARHSQAWVGPNILARKVDTHPEPDLATAEGAKTWFKY